MSSIHSYVVLYHANDLSASKSKYIPLNRYNVNPFYTPYNIH